MFLVQRADDLIGIENFVALRELNIARGNFAFLVDAERKFARLVLGRLEFDAFQIKHDVGDVFHYTGQGRELVLCARNFDCGNGSAFERRKEDAPKRIAYGVAVARFKRFCNKLRVSVRGSLLLLGEGLWHFKPTVTNWHNFSWGNGVVQYSSN